MILNDAIDAGLPLVIELAPNNRRIMAEAFVTANGVAFADVGWAQPGHSGHPFHVVSGEIRGDGPWFVGDKRILELDHDDELVRQWNEWRDFLGSPEGLQATRANAESALTAHGML